MTSANHKRGSDHRLFFGTLWLALATALLFAIVPAGLPGSEARGSAFSPSNASVALRASAAQTPLVTKRATKNDEVEPQVHLASYPDWHPIVIVAVVTLPGRCNERGLFLAGSSRVARSLLSALLCAICPRGPPIG
ncbi:hypothetical protein D9M73_84060 [compost metagenome]|jgi:hypothetical protein